MTAQTFKICPVIKTNQQLELPNNRLQQIPNLSHAFHFGTIHKAILVRNNKFTSRIQFKETPPKLPQYFLLSATVLTLWIQQPRKARTLQVLLITLSVDCSVDLALFLKKS